MRPGPCGLLEALNFLSNLLPEWSMFCLTLFGWFFILKMTKKPNKNKRFFTIGKLTKFVKFIGLVLLLGCFCLALLKGLLCFFGACFWVLFLFFTDFQSFFLWFLLGSLIVFFWFALFA